MKKFSSLNPQQQSAVSYFDSPLLIIAGAGSGKTTVITYKVAYLIENKIVKPENILAITFTNKAAREMKERITNLIDVNQAQPYIGTFHAFCSFILRKEISHFNRAQDFIIYDTNDQKQIMNQVFEKLNFNQDRIHPKKALTIISILKNDLITPQAFKNNPEQFYYEEDLAKIYEVYQNLLIQNNAIDFDDMLFYTVQLFKERQDILEKYQNQFQHILIDEYQDTNFAQYQLTKLLAEKNKKIAVVGDFDQNIYTWRGANVQNILNFEKDYPTSKVILLEQNYRSTKKILKSANHLIKNNLQRKEKNLWTENHDGKDLTYFICYNEFEEVEFVCQQIKKLCKEEHITLNDCVVLYRTNAQSRMVEDIFNRNKINYRLVGGISFYQRKEIKDVLAYLRLIANIHDNNAFFRVLSLFTNGIGTTSIKKIQQKSNENNESVYSLSEKKVLPVTKEQSKKIEHLFEVIKNLKQAYENCQEEKLAFIVKEVLEKTKYKHKLETENTLESLERLENVQELITIGKEDDISLLDFLNNVALLSDLDETSEKGNAVTLMTLHNAKGLEFDVVFLIGMEEGLLPHYKSLFDNSAVEEERRLCYVGITRARKFLYLSSATRRSIFGETWYNDISRFIKELPKETVVCEISNQLIKLEPNIMNKLKEAGIHYEIISDVSEKKAEQIVTNLKKGDIVEHKAWGRGEVTNVKGIGPDSQVTVRFDDEVKTLLLKYAPLLKIT